MAHAIEASARAEPAMSARPYAPSWFDRAKVAVKRAPIPPWLVYTAVAVVPVAPFLWSQWQTGRYDPAFVPFHAFLAALPGAMLGFMHLLDGKAERALNRARPYLSIERAEFHELRYRLTTMPAGPTLGATMVGVILAPLIVVLGLTVAPGFLPSFGIEPGGISTLGFGLMMALVYAVGWPFALHTFLQLRTVRRIFRDQILVDVLDLSPLYGLSNLTAVTAGGLLAQGYVWLLANPRALQAGLVIYPTIGVSLVGAVVFALPLWAVHRRIVDAKAALAADSARRRRTLIGELGRGIDDRDLTAAGPIKDAVLALEADERGIERIRTWPWEPETIRLLATAVLLPSVLFVLQFVLQRALGA